MGQQNRRDQKAAYRQRKITGGVCAIKNTANGKVLLVSTEDLEGIKNRFEFSQQTGGCIHMKLQEDWKKFGVNIFVLEVLEELTKKESQTAKEFKDDINMLKELWSEKFDAGMLY